MAISRRRRITIAGISLASCLAFIITANQLLSKDQYFGLLLIVAAGGTVIEWWLHHRSKRA